jgi:hypothetical protein
LERTLARRKQTRCAAGNHNSDKPTRARARLCKSPKAGRNGRRRCGSFCCSKKFILRYLRLPQYTRQRPGLDFAVQRNDRASAPAPHNDMAAALPKLLKSQPLQCFNHISTG